MHCVLFVVHGRGCSISFFPFKVVIWLVFCYMQPKVSLPDSQLLCGSIRGYENVLATNPKSELHSSRAPSLSLPWRSPAETPRQCQWSWAWALRTRWFLVSLQHKTPQINPKPNCLELPLAWTEKTPTRLLLGHQGAPDSDQPYLTFRFH